MNEKLFDAIVNCNNHPQLQSQSRYVPVYRGMTAAEFLDECFKSFQVGHYVVPDASIQPSLWIKTGTVLEEFKGDLQNELCRSLDNMYTIRYLRMVPLCAVANGRLDGKVVPIYAKQSLLPLFDQIDPAAIWNDLVQSHTSQPGKPVPFIHPNAEYKAYVQGPSIHQRILIPGQTLASTIAMSAQDTILVTAEVPLTLTTSFGVDSPGSVDLSETWELVLTKIMAYAPNVGEAFRAVSKLGVLRADGNWVDSNLSVADTLCPEMRIKLHPIIGCAIIALLDGKLTVFSARLPGDVPIIDLLPELANQMESQLGFAKQDITKLRLVSYDPIGYPDDLRDGRLGMKPKDRLMDVGVQDGWATLLLMQEKSIPEILQFKDVGISVADVSKASSQVGMLPNSAPEDPARTIRPSA